MILGFIVVWIVCAGFAAFIAKSKNRDPGNWFVLGLLFGVFALIGIAAVPALSQASSTEAIAPETAYVEHDPDPRFKGWMTIFWIVLAFAVVACLLFVSWWRSP